MNTNLISEKDFEMKYDEFDIDTITDSEDSNLQTMAQRDLYGYAIDSKLDIKKLIDIYSIFVPRAERNKGIASKRLKSFCEDHNEYLIMVASGASMKEYPIEPSREEYKSILSQLDSFYAKNGFVNTNEYIGNYEHKETFIYKNELGKKFIKYLNELPK
ncbi:MAG: hypothetical protein PHC62_00785 [Candidatus Izemoplasmatales bacterium]|nr:hypothetical protein [Candidatus Izemoplasmatales bacterium]